MQLASINVQVAPDLRRDIDILCRIRDVSLRDWVIEALTAQAGRDIKANETGYRALLAAQIALDMEVEKLRSKGA